MFEKDGFRFNFRVGAIIINEGQLLLCHDPQGDFWYVPGGRVEMGEESRAALKRELAEELGKSVRVGRMLWLIENLFELGGKQFHEIGLYYAVDCPIKPSSKPFEGLENGQPLTFRWFPVAKLPNLKPSFLKLGVRALPVRTKHMIINEISSKAQGSPKV